LISVIKIVKLIILGNMKKNERNAGAKPKFPNVETEILHVRKIVPLGMAKALKQEINERIKNL